MLYTHAGEGCWIGAKLWKANRWRGKTEGEKVDTHHHFFKGEGGCFWNWTIDEFFPVYEKLFYYKWFPSVYKDFGTFLASQFGNSLLCFAVAIREGEERLKGGKGELLHKQSNKIPFSSSFAWKGHFCAHRREEGKLIRIPSPSTRPGHDCHRKQSKQSTSSSYELVC